MIKSWQHKGVRNFYITGSRAEIRTEHAKRLTITLQFLDNAQQASDMDLPDMKLHPLSRKLKNYYSVSVSGNWRGFLNLKVKMRLWLITLIIIE